MNIDITEFTIVGIVVAVYIICAVVKKAGIIPDKLIPGLAGVLGILFAFWMFEDFTFNVFLQGLASGFAATGVNQIYKQLTKEE